MIALIYRLFRARVLFAVAGRLFRLFQSRRAGGRRY